MSSNGGHVDEELVRHVLRYFLNNPQSADSLEGVARWRLLEETIHYTLTETRSALERLVGAGYLRVVSMPGSDKIYVLNLTKREEAERFLKPETPPTKLNTS